MISVAVNGKFISPWTWDRQMFQAQVNVGVVETGSAIHPDGVVFDLRVKHRIAFDAPKFDGENMLALRVASDQREEPKSRQRGAEISDEEAIEKSHQAELP